jgi:hypothetical protein
MDDDESFSSADVLQDSNLFAKDGVGVKESHSSNHCHRVLQWWYSRFIEAT